MRFSACSCRRVPALDRQALGYHPVLLPRASSDARSAGSDRSGHTDGLRAPVSARCSRPADLSVVWARTPRRIRGEGWQAALHGAPVSQRRIRVPRLPCQSRLSERQRPVSITFRERRPAHQPGSCCVSCRPSVRAVDAEGSDPARELGRRGGVRVRRSAARGPRSSA